MATRTAERSEFLHDVLIGFVEDFGSNPWRQIKTWHYDEEDPSKAYAIFLDVEDEESEGKEFRVTIETIAHGINLLLDKHLARGLEANIRQANADNDAGMIDAYDADAIVQAGVFEEVIYG